MRLRPKIWILLCLLCLAGAWFFWQQENGRDGSPSRPREAAAPAVRPHLPPNRPNQTIAPAGQPYLVSTASTNSAASAKTNQFAWRLSNTSKTIGQLVNDRHAILLENALIDTASPLNFSIPKNLQSQGDPGAYIVQAHGPIDNAFRAMLAAAGAEIVSYIPNDAYLVRAPAGVANGLAANPLTQAVIPYEPYYKISSSMPVTVGQKLFSSAPVKTNRATAPSLLVLAVKQAPLPAGTYLKLGLFNNGAAATVAQIEKLGGQIVARDNSPFGPVVRVQPPKDWVALATLPGVQRLEPAHQRVTANDLARVTLGVSTDTLTSTNYLNLYGSNVMVAVNDSGIDAGHPDLTTARVFGATADLSDFNGHGTHVAGIIAGNGISSTNPVNVGAFASGSITNANFRGKAPLATLFSMNNNNSDYVLQTNAALVQAPISNNSWDYGGDYDYDLAAASYDAATRDALTGRPGSQPVLFVFSAGNSGGGGDDGSGGNPDTILSPATAKNVITVGALEQLRNITNVVTKIANGVTNTSTPWQPQTDSSSQVAGFSSRGNVGIGTEGTYGRYKPDVVAPGTFVVSTRSGQWNTNAYYNPTNVSTTDYTFQWVGANALVYYSVSVPPNAISVVITITSNQFSNPFPTNLPIYVQMSSYPDPVNAPGSIDIITSNNMVSIPPDSGGAIVGIQSIQNSGFSFAVGDSTNVSVYYDLSVAISTTNNLGDYYDVLRTNLNDPIGPWYRYESGTSMAAADVSGVLALIEDFFTNTLQATPSPALLKAMLINGARSDGSYDFQVQNSINFQGWGLIYLPNSLPPGLTADVNNGTGEAMLILDQSPTNALATGDSHTYLVTVDTNTDAQYLPLQMTLTWTDPPGDPAAAIKLVNSLELVVSNADTGEVFYGNDIAAGNIYNTAEVATNTPNYDVINNVQNVFIPPLLGTQYSITVIGRSVNVNAVTAQTNNALGNYAPNVVQDYALVISCGEGEVTNAFTVTDNPIVSNPTGDQQITYVVTTNAPLLDQLVGASTPLLGTNTIQLTNGTELNGIQLGGTNIVTLGMTNQWHFYVVTNTGASDFTNAAFITFIPDTLSIPRMGVFADSVGNATRPEADIDLYVSSNPGLMNLDPTVISGADKSLGRGGTEFVYYTNSAPGDVYYVGVYSEDQEAAQYGFMPIFTDIPFSQMNSNGTESVFALHLPVNIPDGNNAHPGVGYVFALAINPMEIQRVVVTNAIAHQNFGDLIGTLAHGQQNGLSETVVLNNHDSLGNTFGPPPRTFIYDDSGQNDIVGSQPSDGPGSLNSYVGQQAIGPWILTEVDDSLTQTGSVTGFSLLIEPHQDLGKGIYGTVYGNSWFYDYIDVPAGATSLTISATNLTVPPASLPLQLFVRLGAEPTLTNYDAMVMLTGTPPPPPGGTISIGPPLAPGRYWVGIWNPNVAAQNFYLIATLGMGTPPGQVIFSSSGPAPIWDDAVITNSIFVTRDEAISSVEAALRVDHPRVSDLVFHLISPAGTRCLLVENRGGTTTEGMGATLAITNVIPISASGGALPTTNFVTVLQTSGTLTITYNFYQAPDQMWVFDSVPNLIFDSGMISGSGIFNISYTNSTQLTIVMNPLGNPVPSTLWDYTVNSSQAKYTYLVLTEDTNKTTTPIKFAPVPFHGFLTNLVTTNTVYITNWVSVTNAAVGWYSGFEGPDIGGDLTGANGWIVNSGNVDVLTTGDFGSTAFEGTNYLDINGDTPGTISTNVPTVSGQTYQLSFAYAQNPDSRTFGQPTVAVQLQANSSPLLTLSITNPANTWTGLGWATTSLLFTATSPTTTFTFASQTPNAYGVLLDAVGLAPLTGNNGFEGAAAGDYAQGHYFDGWFVNNNQVTVISNATLAYSGTNLLALADGTISRILPTVPGQTYTLSYAYRGPSIVSFWRGENNTLDSVDGNTGTWTGLPGGNLNTYGSGEVGQAFVIDGKRRDRVNVGNPANLQLQDFTIDAWVKRASATVVSLDENFQDGSSAGPGGFIFGCGLGGYSLALFDDGGVAMSKAGYDNTSVPPVVTDTNWHHVAVTKSGTTVLFYVDGVTQPTPSVSPYNSTFFFAAGMAIGSIGQDWGNTFYGMIDEPSIYNRPLSASEIQAIYQQGSLGLPKFDPTAPTIAQGLAEAQVAVGGANLIFFGNNTNWQTTNIIFTATQSNMVLQITGIEPGMLLDNFTLSNAVVTTTNVVSTNLNGGDVFYLPEQSLDTFAGESAQGQWQLEIWDNRAGAYDTNNPPELVSWQLRFNFAINPNTITVLTNGLPVTNVIPPGGMAYYLVEVPPNADIATNRLLFATGPLNMWFNQTTLPTGTNPPDYLLITNSTGGSSILSLNSAPTNIVPGGTYYLGVQNLGTASVSYGIEVDFHLLFPPVPPSIGTQYVDELTLMTVTNTATSGIPPYTYSLTSTVTGPNVPVIDANGIITWTPTEAQGPGFYTIQTIITDSSVPPLSSTNSFNVIVIEVNTAPYFLGTPADQTIDPFRTLVVTNAAGDSDIPPNPLTYSLLNPPAGMTIDPNTGVITWTPTLAQILTTNLITTVVTDYNGYAPVNQHLSATNYFTVRVTGFIPPAFAFTQPATSVTGTSAQLNGMATPNGPPTTAWFEWGTTTGYGNQTPPVSVGGGLNVVYVPSQINGLVMNQPYHFRLVVSNFVGVVYGFDQIFDETGVVGWGADYADQTNVPVGLSNVVAIAAAYDHSLALKNDGTVVAWGDNTKNQTNVPPGLNGVVAVAGGEYYSMALKNDGTVVPWGGSILGQTNVPTGLNGVVNIAGGTFSSLALRNDGTVAAWGANFFGLTNVPSSFSNIVAVAGGGYHSLAVKNDGTVLAWGNDSTGQTNVPAGLSNVVAIAAGSFHSLALKNDGTVVAWGDNSDDQTNVPAGLSNVVAVAAGGFHSMVLKNDGSVLAWGDDSENQTNIPPGLSNVVAISSGYFHNLALASSFNVNIATNTPPFFLITNLPPVTMNEMTTLLVTNTANDSDLPPQTLTYTVTMLVDTNAMIANGWPLNYATTNPSPVVNNNGVITWTPGEAQGPGVYIITAVVTDNGVPPLSATNSFIVTVNEVNLPPVLNLPPNTNILEFAAFTAQATATDPDIPPNPLTFALVSGPIGLTVTTNGLITWTPGQPPGPGTYAVTISVTDTNAYALTNQSLSVTNQFNITVTTPPNITINSITHTNIGGTNGFLLQWQGPTNFQYEIQWKTNLLPAVVWNTVVNPVINVVVTSTNGHFSFFDNGTLTGGIGSLKFYRVLGSLNLGTITNSGPATNTVLAGAMSQAVVTVPANAISASNFLISATGPLNVWFNQTNPPVGNTSAGDHLMLSATSAGVFVLSNSVPPLVPGTNYYLGFQNPGASNVTFVFQVAFGFAPASAVSNFSVTATNGGIWLRWNGLTNYQYQVQWTTNLAPPAVWNTISNIVLTSTTGVFTFFDDGSLTGGFGPVKFYRLIAWPFMTPIPQTLFISSVTFTNLSGTNDLMFRWSAPTNYQYGILWTTNLALPLSSWSILASPVLAQTNGVYTFTDNGQTGPPTTAKFFRLYDY